MMGATFAEPVRESGRLAMSVVKKPAITVNEWIRPLGEDAGDAPRVEFRCKERASGILHAVNRPQRLRQTIDIDNIEYCATRMIRGKAFVIRRMPVLRNHDQIEFRDHRVCHRDDRISL